MKFRIIENGDYYDLKVADSCLGWKFLNSKNRDDENAIEFLKIKAKEFSRIGTVIEEFEV